jgi:hypothetical protein
MKKNILIYGGGSISNIGNIFFDMGGKYILEKSFPESNIFYSSQLPKWLFQKCYKEDVDKVFDITSYIKCDLVVIIGMVMCNQFVKTNGDTILNFKKKNIPIMFLSTGALNYNLDEEQIFGKFLKQIDPILFISRDSLSYDIFSKYVKKSYKSIDCGFFLPYYYKLPELLIEPYSVMTFDSKVKFDIKTNYKIINCHHKCINCPSNYFIGKDIIISDLIEDYLTLYKNCIETHSDRVHACVATIAFGNYAKLYNNTKRNLLFNEININNITSNLVKADLNIIEQKRLDLINYLQLNIPLLL